MVLLIALAVAAVVGYLIRKGVNYYSDWETVGLVMLVSGVMFLVLALVVIPLNYYAWEGDIVEYHSLRETVAQARGMDSEIERAALTHKIIEMNTLIARAQYWNQTTWGIFIPNKVMELEPLR